MSIHAFLTEDNYFTSASVLIGLRLNRIANCCEMFCLLEEDASVVVSVNRLEGDDQSTVTDLFVANPSSWIRRLVEKVVIKAVQVFRASARKTTLPIRTNFS